VKPHSSLGKAIPGRRALCVCVDFRSGKVGNLDLPDEFKLAVLCFEW
jgi:hypothetical protein